MLTDTASIGLALVAITSGARARPSGSFTFGLKRSEILSAQLNGAVAAGARRLRWPTRRWAG